MKSSQRVFGVRFILPVLMSVLFSAAHAQTLPSNIEKYTSVEGMTEYRLKSNKLKVLLFPDASKQSITVNVTYMVGSRHEGGGETGMAHLLEHMVFKGSPRHKDVPGEFKLHGARFNGSTWLDRTNYFETFPASEANLDWSLDLKSDCMVNSFIAKKDLETEFSVVRNEFESGENDPSNVLSERVVSTAFLWHNYGKSTIGNRSDIENVPIENLQAFYRKFYQPDNAILLIAGKFDPEKALALVDKYFSAIPMPTRVLQPSYTVEPTQDGERQVTLRRVGDLQLASVGYHIPAGTSSDFAPIEIFVNSLGDNPSGRLYKNLVSAQKASDVSGYAYQTKEPGFVYFEAQVRKEGNVDSAKMILLQTIDDVVAKPFTDEEVKRSRTKILKQLEEAYRNSERTGTLMSEFMALGDWRTFFILRDNLEKVTAADVNRTVKAYFKPSNRTIGIFIPEAKSDRAEIPATPDVSAIVEGYKGRAAMTEGEVFDPTTTNIDSRTKLAKAGTMKYAFLAKKTRGNTVSANITLRYGDINSLQNMTVISSLLGGMMKKGTATMTEQQIKDKLDELKASVSIGSSQDKTFVSIETVRENFPATLKLVCDVLRNSNFPTKEFEEMRQQQLAEKEQGLSDPQTIVFNAVQRYTQPYPKTDTRYTPTLQENIDMLKAVKLDDVKSFYKTFLGASDATASVVGDFDEAEAKKILDDNLATWKSPKNYKRLESKFFDVASKREDLKTPDKANAWFVAQLNLPINENDPEYAQLLVSNYALGGGAISSRLANRIRQKEGLSYGVGSYFNADALDKVANFGAYAIYAPENAKRLEATFKEEIEKFYNEGLTADEFKATKEALLKSRLLARSNDKQLGSKLNSYQFLNRTMKYDADFEDKISKMTLNEANAAIKKYLVPSKISYFYAGDFDKKTAKP